MQDNRTPLNLYCNMNIQRSIFSPECNTTNTILFIDGDCEQVINIIKSIISRNQLENYRSLRIKLKGKVIKPQNICCLLGTILSAAMILLPVICIFTDCWKRKAFKIVQIEESVYESISDLLRRGRFEQFYLMMEDNYFNARKCELLRLGMQRKIKNLFINNTAKHFNCDKNNGSDFEKYITPVLGEVEIGQCRWQKIIFFKNSLVL